jgi:Uma2 family endonuclease
MGNAIMTPEELLKLPDEEHYELVDGKLVERGGGCLTGWIGGRISCLIGKHGDGIGWVIGSGAGYQCFADLMKVRRPNISFIRRGRLPGEVLPEGHCSIAPDLSVIVLSSDDKANVVEERLADYLQAAVPLVWVFYPRTRSVHVYRAKGHSERLTEEHLLRGEEVIPGFSCMVSECFPPAPPASNAA